MEKMLIILRDIRQFYYRFMVIYNKYWYKFVVLYRMMYFCTYLLDYSQ